MALFPAWGIAVIQHTQSFSLLFACAVAASAAAFLAVAPVREIAAQDGGNHAVSLLTIGRRRAVLVPAFALFAAATSYGAVLAFLPVYAPQRGIAGFGVFFTVYAAATLASRVFAGRISDRLGRRRVILPFMALLTAAVFAKGTTVIDNAAREPEIADLCQFLVGMGAQFEGIGSSTLVIHGVERHELHSTDHGLLAENFAHAQRQTRIEHADGFDGVKAILPPPPRRALMLIDPPYEDKRDYARVLTCLKESFKRFATGCYAIWYPIVGRQEAHDLPRRLKKICAAAGKEWLHATLNIGTGDEAYTPDPKLSRTATGRYVPVAANKTFTGLRESGMFIVNPPFVLAEQLQAALPQRGLSGASLLYEAVSEGGITHLLAVYANPALLPQVGPVCDARPQHVQLAFPLDAVLVYRSGTEASDALLEQCGWQQRTLSGSAEQGALNVVVAGDPGQIDRVQELFDVIGSRTWRLGDVPEQANAVKILGNYLLACAIESLGEAVGLAEKAGVDPAQLVELMTTTLFPGPVYATYGGLIAERRYQPAGFTTVLGRKDVHLALDAADAVGATLPFGDVLREVFEQALAQGRADDDWASIAELRR